MTVNPEQYEQGIEGPTPQTEGEWRIAIFNEVRATRKDVRNMAWALSKCQGSCVHKRKNLRYAIAAVAGIAIAALIASGKDAASAIGKAFISLLGII